MVWYGMVWYGLTMMMNDYLVETEQLTSQLPAPRQNPPSSCQLECHMLILPRYVIINGTDHTWDRPPAEGKFIAPILLFGCPLVWFPGCRLEPLLRFKAAAPPRPTLFFFFFGWLVGWFVFFSGPFWRVIKSIQCFLGPCDHDGWEKKKGWIRSASFGHIPDNNHS